MSALRQLLFRLRTLVRRGSLERDMAEEMRFHLRQRTADEIARGLTPQEARRAAEVKFGNLGAIQEAARDERGLVWLEQTIQDLRYAGRQLARAPGFTTTIVVTLALGIGACITISSLVQSVLLDGFGAGPDRRVAFVETRAPNPTPLEVSTGEVAEWEALSSIADLCHYGRGTQTLTGEGEPRRVDIRYVSQNYLPFFEANFLLGRNFSLEEVAANRGGVIVLTEAFWRRVFGGRPDVVGRPITMNGAAYTVIGVAATRVRAGGADFDVYLPSWLTGAGRTNYLGAAMTGFGRLRPGVTLAAAQAELDVVSARLAVQFPEARKDIVTRLALLRDYLTAETRPWLWTLFAAVVCVLLIACVNVANLLLARAAVRQREFSVRAALGASPGRLARQLLAESLLLALLGGAGGLLFAHSALRLLNLHPRVLALRDATFALDSRMVWFALAVTLLTVVAFGFAPAWVAARARLTEAFVSAGRGPAASGALARLRRSLVVFEIACAVTLLSAAGLLIRSYVQLTGIDSGLVTEHACIMGVTLPNDPKYANAEQRLAFVDAVLARMLALPGVQAAGITQFVPFAYTAVNSRPFAIEGRPVADEAARPRIKLATVSPGYFPAAGVHLLRGRLLTSDDRHGAPPVVVINDALARQHYPGENPIGRRIGVHGPNQWSVIVGIVGDVTQSSPELPIMAQAYVPYAQQPGGWMNFVVRTGGDVRAMAPTLRAQVYAVDPNQPLGPFRLLQEVLDERVGSRRFELHLLSSFSLLALMIASVGIYGLIAYSVHQRTTEIGIRLALGAAPRDVLRLIFGQGVRLVGLGLLMGGVGALGAGRVIESRLYRLSAHDPLTLATVLLAFGAIAALACWLPARRATRVDPMIALRAE